MNKIAPQSGFTLIELMVTVAVAAIVFTVAVPSFDAFIRNNRLITQSNQLVTTLNLARSESIKRGVRVTACKSANGTACATSGGWEQGWVVFVDSSNTGTIDAGEAVLRTFGKLSATTLIGNGNFINWISYLPSGISQGDTPSTSPLANGTFKLCQGTGSKGKNIVVNNTGRARIEDVIC